MKKLLIIDPQNDFCDIPGAALPVAGAHADMQRLAAFVAQSGIDDITVTLDSHPYVAVERTTFWVDASGARVAAFTVITADAVRAGTYRPRQPHYTSAVLAMLERLHERGNPATKDGLIVWPVHCVSASWGHNIHSELAKQLNAWELHTQRPVHKVHKGEYFLTEHFGVFEADAPDAQVPSTQFNTALAQNLLADADVLYLAGEASSHCVAASFDQLVGYLQAQKITAPPIVVLCDCMSAVVGFEAQADAFFERAAAFGARILTAQEALQLAFSK